MQKTKFKHTEVGEIPEDWEITEFIELLSKKTRNGVYKQKEFHGSGIKIINMKELFSFPRIGEQEMKRVKLSDSEMSRFLVREGDLIFARRSLVAAGSGKCSIIVKHTEPITFESSIILARPNKKTADSEFLYYFFLSPKGQYVMGTILRQVAVSGITGTDLMGLKVVKPPLPEQQSIAKVLSNLDSQIEILQQQNETLEAIGKALFKHWFIDFEFPNEEWKPYKSSGGKMVESEFGEIPKGWEVKPLDKIAYYLNGLALQKFPPSGKNDLPVIKIKELKNGITQSTDYANRNLDEKYIIRDGDVLFSWSGSLEVEFWANGEGALNQHLFKVSSDTFPKWFYYYWTLAHLEKFIGIANDKATTMGHIQRGHLSKSLTLVPDKNTFKKMNSIFGPVVDSIIQNKIRIRTFSKIRDHLLPKLMSGKIRVQVSA